MKSLLGHPLGRLGLVVLFVWLTAAITADLWVPDQTRHANDMHLAHAAKSIGYERPLADGSTHQTHYMGTDRYGRDVLSRLALGSRVSLSVGFIAVTIALFIGIPFGAIAGYYGGWTDRVLSSIIQVFWSIPTFLMVIALSFVLGKGYWQVFIAVGLTAWVEVARLVRGQVLTIMEMEYVQAAKVLGYGPLRILRKHVLPQVIPALTVLAASQFAMAILLESGLSFLGIGAQPPMPSWGGMIRDHYPYLLTGQAHLALIPGLSLASVVLAFMAIGNALRDVLDVRTQTT